MLEMSNGYPSSPLGASPSPSPGLGGHHSKCKYILFEIMFLYIRSIN